MRNTVKEDSKRGFDRLYDSTGCVWGLEADRYLATFLDRAPRGTALDVGCGEGRHALFLAQAGYSVDALDMSEKAIEKLNFRIEEYGVKGLVLPRVVDMRAVDLPEDYYDLAVISYVFPFLRFSEINSVLERVKASLRSKGCIYVSALTTEDPEYGNYSREQQPVEPRTFYSPGLMCYCYYFERNELRELFSDFSIIDYTETVVELPREPYQHAMCLIFAEKR